MKNTIALSIVLVSLSATAKDTMDTELDSGDAWLKGSFANASVDTDRESQGTGQKESTEENVGFSEISFITAFNSVNDFTPLFGASVAKLDADDDSVSFFDISAGGLFKTKEQKTYAIFGTLNSTDDDNYRESLELNMRAQTTSLESDVYNEVSIDAEYIFKKNDITGGHRLNISTATRIDIDPNLEFEILAGLILQTDTDLSGNVSQSFDPSFNFGGKLNMDIVSSMTLEVGLTRRFYSSVIDYDGEKIDSDSDITRVSVNLVKRF